jgi:transposase-like protein
MDQVEHVLALIKEFSDAELDALRQKLDLLKPIQTAKTETAKLAILQHMKRKVHCPNCDSASVKGHGKYRDRRRYKCLLCGQTFNDLTQTPLAGIHSAEKMIQFASRMARGGSSLRKSAEEFEISLPTAFNWRHRIIQGYSVAPMRKLKGIAEADETFFLFSEKGNKSVSKQRKPRKRGGKASKRGISDEQVPLIVGCDREGELVLGVAGRGRISLKNIEEVLGNRIADDATLCTDSHPSFRAFAKANEIKYRPVNISKGCRVAEKIFHIQHVNSAHTRLKGWLARFYGVSTKYLDNYAQWFGLMEEIKPLNDCEEKFTERSVMGCRKKKPQSS